MDGGAVLGVICLHAPWGPVPAPMRVVSTGRREIARRAHAQLVGELDPHRPVALGHDHGSQILRRRGRTGAEVNITPEFGGSLGRSVCSLALRIT